jgi:hypothetical protein
MWLFAMIATDLAAGAYTPIVDTCPTGTYVDWLGGRIFILCFLIILNILNIPNILSRNGENAWK